MATRNKNRQIVLLTLFAMTLVVIGHSDIDKQFTELWIFRWVYTFHMPLFFFISGFLFCLTMPASKLQNTTFVSFIKKKAVRLLIPFLFINTVIFIIKSVAINDTSMMKHPQSLDWQSFIDATFFHPIGFMWFLPALFMIFLYSFPIWKGLKKISAKSRHGYIPIWVFMIVILVYVAHIFLPWTSFMQASRALGFMTYFLLGILYCDYKSLVDKFLRKYWVLIGVMFFILSASMIFKGTMAGLCGIIFSVTFALILENKCHDKLVEVSAFCYTVFLLSYFPQMFIRGPIAHRFPDINHYVLSAFSFASGLLFPICFCMIFVKLKNKYKPIGRLGVLIGL